MPIKEKMQGIAKISGKISGEYSCKMRTDDKVLEIYVPSKNFMGNLQEVFFANKGIMEVTSLCLNNLSGEKFSNLEKFEALIISISPAGWSITDNLLDELLDKNQENSYHILKVIPKNRSIKLTTNLIRDEVVVNYSNSNLFNQYECAEIMINSHKGDYYISKTDSGMAFRGRSCVSKETIAAISLIQGVKPIFEGSINGKEIEIGFDKDLIQNRETENIIYKNIKKLNGNGDDYCKEISNFINKFESYIDGLNSVKKENFINAIYMFIDSKSLPVNNENKLILITTVIESLSEIVHAHSEKIDEILTSIQIRARLPITKDHNVMIKLLRNGLVHYLDPLEKIQKKDNKIYLDIFCNTYKANSNKVYVFIKNILNDFFINEFK